MKNTFDTDASPLPERIATGLSKIGLALKFQSWQAAGERGLSPTQGQILAMLVSAKGGVKPSALAERLAVSAPTVSDSVKALMAKGLVERRADDTDARVSLVVATASGRAAGRSASSWPDFLVDAIDALSPAEQEPFFRSLLKMIATLQRENRIPVLQMCLTCRHFRPNVHAKSDTPHHCAFVDAPMGARHLRLECADQTPADAAQQDAAWASFTQS